jgi:hypothetical protein
MRGGLRNAQTVLYSTYSFLVSPALAEITGAGREWTVLMISELSIPCR